MLLRNAETKSSAASSKHVGKAAAPNFPFTTATTSTLWTLLPPKKKRKRKESKKWRENSSYTTTFLSKNTSTGRKRRKKWWGRQQGPSIPGTTWRKIYRSMTSSLELCWGREPSERCCWWRRKTPKSCSPWSQSTRTISSKRIKSNTPKLKRWSWNMSTTLSW